MTSFLIAVKIVVLLATILLAYACFLTSVEAGKDEPKDAAQRWFNRWLGLIFAFLFFWAHIALWSWKIHG